MPENVLGAAPADDSGSRTARRYAYQAEFAFKFCLSCALSTGVDLVILEHHEDVVVRMGGTWFFCQVKTKEPGLLPWRFSDLVADDGPLRSLFRTHRCLEGFADVVLVAALEGHTSTKDRHIQLLRSPTGRLSGDLVEVLATRLDATTDETRAFLQRLEIWDGLPSREHILSVNLDLLSRAGGDLTGSQLQEIYGRFMAAIRTAMEDSLGEADWQLAILRPEGAGADQGALVRRKTLDVGVLAPFADAFRSRAPPRLEVIAPSVLSESSLEMKMEKGGANQGMIQQARSLRARASAVEFELLGGSIDEARNADLQDTRARLQIRHTSILAQQAGQPSPAIPLWSDLISHLSQEAGQVDPRRVFGGDAYLLLGEICQMADECILDFGEGRHEA